MDLITPTALAKKIGISKQAVFKSIEDGRLPFILKGKMKKIDLDDNGVKSYIKNESRQRENAKKNESEKQPKKVAKTKKSSKKQSKKVSKKLRPSNLEDEINIENDDSDSLTPFQIRLRKDFAIMRKKEIEAEIAEKKSLPIEFVQYFLFKHLEKLHVTIERIASVGLPEIGAEIIESGEVKPEHIDKFTSIHLEGIHNTKKAIIKEIKKYEPKL
jgi:flagellar biosynthesis GTPase FlhF